MKSVFKVDYTSLDAVRALAQHFYGKGFIQYIYKHPSRANYNLTMQKKIAESEGSTIVCWYDGEWH